MDNDQKVKLLSHALYTAVCLRGYSPIGFNIYTVEAGDPVIYHFDALLNPDNISFLPAVTETQRKEWNEILRYSKCAYLVTKEGQPVQPIHNSMVRKYITELYRNISESKSDRYIECTKEVTILSESLYGVSVRLVAGQAESIQTYSEPWDSPDERN